jgi:phosphatidylglycerol:prolipoprotein diacylglycerol transferase
MSFGRFVPHSTPVHPIAIDLGIKIHWYGILIAAGFLAGVWTASRRGLQNGLDPARISDLAMWLLVGAIVGARALHVISYWREDFAGRPLYEIFMIQRGGLVFYGGLIGATLAGAIYVRAKKLPFLRLADALAPSIALGSVFGRIGCLMTGCCYGAHCDLPWAIRFPEEHETHGTPVHPTQLYDSFANLLLYLGLAWLYRRRKFDGQVFATFLIGYAVLRFVVEMFRGDYQPGEFHAGMTPGQVVSVAIFAIGAVVFVLLPRLKAEAK